MSDKLKLKLKKLTFECQGNDGATYNRVLERPDDVKQWNEWMTFVCQYADEAGVNPRWHDLNWEQIEIKPKRIRKKKEDLVEDVTENK